MSSSSVETRDSAIQMLDKFIAVLGKQNRITPPRNFNHKNFNKMSDLPQ
jgi:hypothetical protein